MRRRIGRWGWGQSEITCASHLLPTLRGSRWYSVQFHDVSRCFTVFSWWTEGVGRGTGLFHRQNSSPLKFYLSPFEWCVRSLVEKLTLKTDNRKLINIEKRLPFKYKYCLLFLIKKRKKTFHRWSIEFNNQEKWVSLIYQHCSFLVRFILDFGIET